MNMLEALRLCCNGNSVKVRPRCWRDSDSPAYRRVDSVIMTNKNKFQLYEKVGKMYVSSGPLNLIYFDEIFSLDWEIVNE